MTDRLVSGNGQYQAVMQDDGNFVVYEVATGRVVSAAGSRVDPLVITSPAPAPLPTPEAPTRVEGFGVSYYTAPTDPHCDPFEWAERTAAAGSRHTRVWPIDAWANGRLESGVGMYGGFQPWPLQGSQFDLSRINESYLDRLDQFLTAFHATWQHVCLSILELYTWSARKAGKLWVPNRDLQPQRNNRQGIRWGDPDDDHWLETALPDEALASLLVAIIMVIGDRWPYVTFEIGNELPEKGLHYRMRDLLRSLGWKGRMQVNRNEDTPSQYDNMRIGTDFDALAIHGRSSLAYLDEDFGPEQHAYRTFRAAFDSGTIDPTRFVVSTDGVGRNSAPFYDEADLIAVSHDALARGYAVEHQAREIKLGRFLQGRLDLNDLNVDLIRRMQA